MSRDIKKFGTRSLFRKQRAQEGLRDRRRQREHGVQPRGPAGKIAHNVIAQAQHLYKAEGQRQEVRMHNERCVHRRDDAEGVGCSLCEREEEMKENETNIGTALRSASAY